MTPREDLEETRKGQIVEAASKVFARKGLQKARMDDIVDESGLSKGALYWYFKSKDEIIDALLKKFLDRELQALEKIQQAKGPTAERIQDFVNLVVADIQNLKYFSSISFEFYAMALRSKRIQKLFTEYFNRFKEVITPIIEQGIREGEFRNVNSLEVVVAIGALIEGTILLYAFDPVAIDIEKYVNSGMNLILNGLLANGSKESNGGR